MAGVFTLSVKQLVSVDPALARDDNPLGVIDDAMLVMGEGKILWLGRRDNFPVETYGHDTRPLLPDTDTRHLVMLPGLIDSHTHPVFAGDRAREFEMRLQGKTYQEIAASGGGIQTTVQATRKAGEDELFTLAQSRLETMLSFGVTAVEAKSGYGLDAESELKSLRVIQRLKDALPQTVVATYMGAHDIPPEYKGRTEAYVDRLCAVDIPEIAKSGLAQFCDVFCETGYFDVAQSRRILQAAKANGLGVKVHAEEFTDIGGAVMAGELGASSADHLLHISPEGIAALKAGGTVATLLPGTAFYLRVPYAPARKILDAGVDVAIATDFNPGSCMSENLQWMMTLACLNMQMTPVEVIRAVTINAARALNLADTHGSLAAGKRADCVLFEAGSYQELLYHYGVNLVRHVVIGGTEAYRHQPGHVLPPSIPRLS